MSRPCRLAGLGMDPNSSRLRDKTVQTVVFRIVLGSKILGTEIRRFPRVCEGCPSDRIPSWSVCSRLGLRWLDSGSLWWVVARMPLGAPV